MKKTLIALLLLCVAVTAGARKKAKTPAALFPDGTPVPAWFADTAKVDVNGLGRRYVVTDYGVSTDSTLLQTQKLQAVIDRCADEGGGVVVLPRGTFLSGALFFKPRTHLHFDDGAKLKGVDAIKHYPLVEMHMEGKNMKYFAALVNADGVDGFTITGRGTIDGNGRRFWEEFWIRRQWNAKCTNLEALRPQLVYISRSDDVTVQDVRLVNSAFWTNHLYRCRRTRFLDCHIESPTEGETHAPSSDGIDLDICDDVLVRGCYVNVCDDGVCIKGGKGTFVDRDTTSGPVNRVIVEKCRFGRYTNAGVTFGSEAWNVHNVVMRDCHFEGSGHVVLFKMRPDTPQTYADVLVERCTGRVKRAIEISTWRQFHSLEERPDMPVSSVSNITIRDLDISSNAFFVVKRGAPFNMSGVHLENVVVTDKAGTFNVKGIENLSMRNVTLNGKRMDAGDNKHDRKLNKKSKKK